MLPLHGGLQMNIGCHFATKTIQKWAFLLLFLSLWPLMLSAQTQISRQVIGNAGGQTESGRHRIHGTLSQTSVGLLPRRDDSLHGVGFWYKAEILASAHVRFPIIEAEVGTIVTIPLILEDSERLLRYGPRSFRARIRFNRSLLVPEGTTPFCSPDGDDCVMEITGLATGRETDTIARLDFRATLGNAESTPLIIEEIVWESKAERRFVAEKVNGEFRLLGVCREGEGLRLIRAGGPASRLRAIPNITDGPAAIEYVAGEAGQMRLVVVDQLGREETVLFHGTVDAARLYQNSFDLSRLSTGSYFLVMRTATETLIEQLIIQK